MAALTLEQKLEMGASDLRFLLTNHGVQDAHQGALFEAGVDTMAKFAAFVTTAADLVEVLKKEFSLDPATSLVMYNALAMIKLKHPGRNELTDINADFPEALGYSWDARPLQDSGRDRDDIRILGHLLREVGSK